MSPAQLAQLQADAEDPTLFVSAKDTLPRLLEERRRLLEAAHNGGLADAIAFAEEEVPE